MHWAHPKLSKRQTVHLPCKQSPDIAARVIANGRHLLCVPDKGTHLTVTWFDVHTHTLTNICSNVSIYKHGRTSHADMQRHTKQISCSVSLCHLVAKTCMSLADVQCHRQGEGKKLRSQAKACQSHFTLSILVTNPVIQTSHYRPVHMVTCLMSLCQSQPTELKHRLDKSMDANPTSQENSPPS